MEDKNKVQVKIYGQEFTISGKLPREHIIKVADHVDRAMHRLSENLPSCSVSSLAVLAAVNSTDEYFRIMEELNAQMAKSQQLEKDARHYVQLWDEAKKNFLQYKEDAQASLENKEELQRGYNNKVLECKELMERIEDLEELNENLSLKNEGLSSRLQTKEEERTASASIIKDLETKFKDTESNFFDLQMENIRLKSELDRLKRNTEELE